MNEELKEFWKKVLSEVGGTSDPTAFEGFVRSAIPQKLTENELYITCKSGFMRGQLEKNASVIKKAIKKVSGKEYEIKISVQGTEKNEKNIDLPGSLFTAPKDPNVVLREKQSKAGLYPKYTFETYVMGKNNQLAYAVATTVAERPGEAYNPVFLYSGVGLGKTHLIQAIGNKILEKKPGTKVVYITGESFTNELIESIQSGKGKGRYTSNEFRQKFRKADVFLIDDIQFIIGRGTTTEEFFHTYNALYMAQKQIIITSDRPPKDFNALENRITSRFSSGIIVDIQPPDLEMRTAILRRKRDENHDPVPNDVIDLIAETVDTNVRELEGAYLRVLTDAKTSNFDITKETAAKTLGQSIKEKEVRPVNMNQILRAVCTYYSVKSNDIKGKRRTKELVLPRQVAMYLIKDLTKTPLMSIGEFLGGRDHTTIIYGVEKVEKESAYLGKLRQDISNVKQIIYAE